ncbi:FAD-dependent oxidoreductase [Vibrio sp. SM6]|uniref:FAD-dependent oxidoreductase n=1 Tax=Vibrio agarilyticus TaxID=2726741 RepID=A0A7X8TQI3_9VIBR|nr:FAD-dependent oxidoreductase [Vibrio agarilyticus]NLS12966.1 FAD-dependent oxidoreductase [Vibrio agarilyticus]
MSHAAFWFKQAIEKEQPTAAPALSHNIETDILIVGGGYTGLWSAILIKQQAPHRKVTLIEKGLCGSGASGANGGCMLTWSTKFPTLKRLFGEQHAAWLVAESERAVEEIAAFCAHYAVDAELSKKGVYYTATNQAQCGSMAPVVDELTRLNVNSWQRCNSATLHQKAGSTRHVEGFHSPVAASVQPALLARELRRVALALGVELYENTAMTRLEFGQPATVTTPQANIRANKVILALNAWMVEHFREFNNTIVVVSSDMVITEPLADKLPKVGWERGSSVLDSRIFVHYYRDTPDGRMMLGKGGNKFSFNNQVDPMFNVTSNYRPMLEKAFKQLFPSLANEKLADCWTGGSDRSATGFPFFGQLRKQSNVVYGLGYSGNGVSQTRIGGKILASMALDLNNEWTQCGLAQGPLGHFPPEPFRWCGAMMVRNAVRRKEEAEDRGENPFIIDKWLAKLAGAAGKADKIEG